MTHNNCYVLITLALILLFFAGLEKYRLTKKIDELVARLRKGTTADGQNTNEKGQEIE